MQSESSPTREWKWRPLGGRLKQARNRTGLTQGQVAERFSVNPQTVWYWEAGRSRPAHNRLSLLATLYGVSVDWLLGREMEEIDIDDPDLEMFFRGEWQELTERQRDIVRTAVRIAREDKRHQEEEERRRDREQGSAE